MRAWLWGVVVLASLVTSLLHLVWSTLQYGFPEELPPNLLDIRRVADSPTNISWFVHITDLHLSKFHAHERTSGFLRLTEEVVRHVRPAAVVVTGDLTDAKAEDYSGSHQFLEEWQDYRTAVDLVANQTVWLDIRGNHDNFDVPGLRDKENYFKDFSSQGAQGNLESYLRIVHDNGVKLGFLALDATLKPVGPRRPFNFVGALNQQELDGLASLASKSEKEADATIWFGHYPTSTIVAPSPGPRHVMTNGLVYLCGHLHNLHGLADTMVVRHSNGLREAELADWKENRMFRLMVVDHGVLSWRDVKAVTRLPLPLVIVTWPPTGPRAGDREPLHLLRTSSHIRLLVFSRTGKTTVRVAVDGEELVTANNTGGPLFAVPWWPELYRDGHHTVRVEVEEAGDVVLSEVHHFSLDGSSGQLPFLGRIILLVDLIPVLQFLFILLVCVCVVPLTLLRHNPAPPLTPRCLLPLARLSQTYWPLVLAPLYLTLGPWFVGEVLSGSLGAVFLWGTLVLGSYLPTATTWLYGIYHLIGINIPVTIATVLILHFRLSESKSNPRHPLLNCLLYHSLMSLLVLLQVYLVHSFYLSYGLWAVILGPFRTGHLALTLYLWAQAVNLPKKQLLATLKD